MTEDFQVPNEKDQPNKITAYKFDDLNDLIETGNAIKVNGKMYYNLPYWFTRAPGGSGWYVYFLDDLPEELQEAITKSFLGGDNPQIKEAEYPKTEKDAYKRS